MKQIAEERDLTVPPFSVHTVGDRFVEIHFCDRVNPSKEVREYLRGNGFRFYENCNGREEPRWGRKQSIQSWAFVQEFMDEFGNDYLEPDAIPDIYRLDRPWAPPVHVSPPAAPPPQPPKETMARTKVAPGQLDFTSLFEDIFALANNAVAELDEQAQRRAKLLAEIEKWKGWRASWIGGDYRWMLVNSAIGMMMTGSALVLVKESCNSPTLVHSMIEAQKAAVVDEEGEELKKSEPLSLPELPLESTVEATEAQADTTTETNADPTKNPEESVLILTPPVERSPKKPRPAKKGPKVRSKFPKPTLAGEAVWLDDDELAGTESYLGCYAVLRGQLGLSFKGLPHDQHRSIDGKEYIARPGTFQPLTLEPWMETRLKLLITVCEAYMSLVGAESDPGLDEEEVEDRRELLNLAYDDFVVEAGFIHQNKGLMHFRGDTDTRLFMLMALEQEDSDNGTYEKASIFNDRQQYPSPPPTGQCCFDDDPEERCKAAYIRCLDERGGHFDLALTALMAGLDEEEIEEILCNTTPHPILYRMPVED